MTDPSIEDVWHQEAPHVLGALRRRFRDVHRCEDAAQDALEAALDQWARCGMPRSPRRWLITVASRRVIDGLRRDEARTMREHLTAVRERRDDGVHVDPELGDDPLRRRWDDTLEMLLLCCHPALTAETQIILSLSVVVGLPTSHVADAFYLTEATTAQRISRAKATIRRHGKIPAPDDSRERLAGVLHALYLMYTQGHTVSRGAELHDVSLTREAIRLAGELRAALPTESEPAALLALMLLTEARNQARVGPGGRLVPLAAQDRKLWDRMQLAQGIRLVEWALPRGRVGPYGLQAAIAAVHAEALTWETTDWPQILFLYRHLEQLAPSPTVTLNRAVAEAMAIGPRCALATLEGMSLADRQSQGHRYYAALAHVHEQCGQAAAAAEAYQRAADLCRSAPERTYLAGQLDRLLTPEQD